MKLKQSVCLAFILFPTLSFANNEFNSIVEDFERYSAAQDENRPKPKTSAKISPSSKKNQVNNVQKTPIAKPEIKQAEKESETVSNNKSENTANILLLEQNSVSPSYYPKINGDYSRYLTPLLSFIPIQSQFSPKDLLRDNITDPIIIYNPLSLYTKTPYLGQPNNSVLDLIPNTIYATSAIPFYFISQLKRSLLDYQQPLFNQQLLEQLAVARRKYDSLLESTSQQSTKLAEYLTQLENTNLQINQLKTALAETEAKLLTANTLLKDDTAKNEITSLQETLATFEAEKNQLTEKLNTSQTLLTQLEQEKTALETQYNEVQRSFTNSNQENTQQLSQLETAKNKEIAALQTNLNNEKSTQEKLLQQLAQVQNQLAQIEQDKSNIETQLSQAQSLLKDDTAKNEITSLQASLLAMTTEREDISKLLAKNKAEYDTILQKNKQLVDNQQQEITQLTTRINENKQVQIQLNNALLAANQQKTDTDEKLKVIPELQLELKNKVNELAELKSGLSAGEKTIESLISDKNSLITKLEKTQSELSEKYQTLDTQFQASNNAIKQLNTDKVNSEKAYALLEQQLADKQSAADKLTTQLVQVQAQLEKQQTESNDLFNTLKQQQEQTIVQSKQQQNSLSGTEKQLNDIMQQLTAQKILTQTLEEKSAQLNEQIKSKDAELAKINTETDSIKKENKTLKEDLQKIMGEGQMIANQLTYAYSVIGKDNAKRNKSILSSIQKQNYIQYDDNTYFKILKQGKPVASIASKTVKFTMYEELTDGSVTLNYDKSKPVIMPYRQLPLPLNTFIAKAGINGKAKIYIKPGGGYGEKGVPGQIPPESMSIVTIEVLDAK